MTRFADINQIAADETKHELIEPGSGIGKFGNYPAGDILANAMNRDNIRPPAQNPDSPRAMKRRMALLEDENRSLKSQLEKKDKLLIEKDNQIKALAGQEVRNQ